MSRDVSLHVLPYLALTVHCCLVVLLVWLWPCGRQGFGVTRVMVMCPAMAKQLTYLRSNSLAGCCAEHLQPLAVLVHEQLTHSRFVGAESPIHALVLVQSLSTA